MIARPTPIRRLVAWEHLPPRCWLTCARCGVSLSGVDSAHEVGGLDAARRWCRRCADALDLAGVA